MTSRLDVVLCCSLPKPVQRRVKALKRLQRDMFEIELKFYEEMHTLEHKYENLYSSLYDKVSCLLPVVCSGVISTCAAHCGPVLAPGL